MQTFFMLSIYFGVKRNLKETRVIRKVCKWQESKSWKYGTVKWEMTNVTHLMEVRMKVRL